MAYRPIFYDTETTGVKSDNDRIIELAAFDPVNDTTFSKLINPKMSIPPDSTAIHHITDEMVKDAPEFNEVGLEFLHFCQGDVVLIAHNNDAFDIHFLKAEYDRAEIKMPEWKTLDTLKWARKYRRDLPRHALQYLREFYSIEQNQAHRALEDVKVLYQVYKKMTDDLSIEQALTLMNEKPKIPRMPFGKYQGRPLQDIPSTYISWLDKNGVFAKKENQELKENFEKIGSLQNA